MKYIMIIMLSAISGCYYIHQDWDMYDDQRQDKVNTPTDAGDAHSE